VSQANQTVVLYKRHNPTCKVHKTRLPHAARRFWMECSCPIWIVGRTPRGDVVPRQSTGFSDLKQAEAVRASLIAQIKDETVHGPTVAECAEKYLASRRHELGEKTVGQHRLLLGRLATFCEDRDAPYMHNLTVDLLETFKTEGLPADMADTSKATAVAKLRCFLRTAYARGTGGDRPSRKSQVASLSLLAGYRKSRRSGAICARPTPAERSQGSLETVAVRA
jgi:hypothetical protein